MLYGLRGVFRTQFILSKKTLPDFFRNIFFRRSVSNVCDHRISVYYIGLVSGAPGNNILQNFRQTAFSEVGWPRCSVSSGCFFATYLFCGIRRGERRLFRTIRPKYRSFLLSDCCNSFSFTTRSRNIGNFLKILSEQ